MSWVVMNDESQSNKEHFQRIRVKREAQREWQDRWKVCKDRRMQKEAAQGGIQCSIREWAVAPSKRASLKPDSREWVNLQRLLSPAGSSAALAEPWGSRELWLYLIKRPSPSVYLSAVCSPDFQSTQESAPECTIWGRRGEPAQLSSQATELSVAIRGSWYANKRSYWSEDCSDRHLTLV